MTLFRIGLVLALAIAAAIAANVVLLRVASGRHEPVGKLGPRAEITQPAKLPTSTISEHHREEADD